MKKTLCNLINSVNDEALIEYLLLFAKEFISVTDLPQQKTA